jgi:acyl-CoA thioesterase-1
MFESEAMPQVSRKLLLLYLLMMWSVGTAAVQTVPASTTAKTHQASVILVLGDSLSAAFGIEQEQGWVNLLQQRLQAGHYPYRVVNASISGETTQGGASRIDGLLKQYQPAIVLVELGGNDGLRGLPLEVIRASLEHIIKAIRARSIQCLLIGMRLPPNYGPQYTRQFAQLYQELAKQYRLPLVPFLMQGFASNFQLIQSDGIHPTAEAQPLMLDNVWPILLPLLEK